MTSMLLKTYVLQESDEMKQQTFQDREEAYAHAYASCIWNDEAYLDKLIADAKNIMEPLVIVRGFTNHDFDIPRHEPMPFNEASDRFKEMNSPTVSFWLVHKINEGHTTVSGGDEFESSSNDSDKLNIFPYYYDRTGQNGVDYDGTGHKRIEYHDLRSFIERGLSKAQDKLNANNGKYSGYAHLPNQKAIDRGYAALSALGGMSISAEKGLSSERKK